MPTITFTSAKSWLTWLAIWGTILLLLVLLAQDVLSDSSLAGKLTRSAFLLLVSGFLLWTWFGTYYRVTDHHLYYRCGPWHGRIPIQDIRIIKQRERLWSGLRPALGLQGIVLHYGKWDEIYLSPDRQEEFIEQLRKVNPGIMVTTDNRK
jgi:hypothetical protein